ncbi:MAG: 3,4-dihydroxy-2-butanone-4-phosphate synthase [Gammaproteobacteria bacterium]|nr:3,4-dihydroxy-2-butanone-4-phosphate synthase [Gammaproteobacteria bacterium]
MGLASVEEAIRQVAGGGFVIVVDDEDRENEGDLIIAAEKATPEAIAFMVRHTSGLICAPCEPERLDALALPLMVAANQEAHRCAYTISVDVRAGMTTGIAAAERARTLNALADPDAVAEDFVRPGHVIPLRYEPGGVLVRSGHTEAAVDLARLAGLQPAGAICELVHDDGRMQRLPELLEFGERHNLPVISIEALIRYRARHDVLVTELSREPVELGGQSFTVHVFQARFDQRPILALVRGVIRAETPTLVRVIKGLAHRDLLASALTPGNPVHRTLELLTESAAGVLVYLPPDPPAADASGMGGSVWRRVGLGSAVLSSLGVGRIDLLASKELSFPGIASFGLRIESLVKEA